MRAYTAQVIRCAITHLKGYGEDPVQARRVLLERARGWIVDGIDLIQVREKHLEGSDLLALVEDLVRLAEGSATQVLVNSRADVAVSGGAHGVHLPADSGALRPEQVRAVFAAAAQGRPVVSLSCHSLAQVQHAVKAEADLVLFGPIYEKRVSSRLVQAGVGLDSLRLVVAAAGAVPVLALGGVTRDRARECLDAGAGGFASIREFA